MNVLALEFSSVVRSLAVVEFSEAGERVLAEIADRDYRTHTAVSLLDRLVREANVPPASIDLIAVGLGPGSYTGIRSAIAIAQGWQLAHGTRTIGVGSVETMAVQGREEGMRGRVNIIIDAQRKEVYAAACDLSAEPPNIEPLSIVTPESLPGGVPVIGPEAKLFIPGAREIFPNARVLARLASARTGATPAETLEPIYLRPVAFVKAPPPRRIE